MDRCTSPADHAMRLTYARIAPLDDREMTVEQRSLLHPFAERGRRRQSG